MKLTPPSPMRCAQLILAGLICSSSELHRLALGMAAPIPLVLLQGCTIGLWVAAAGVLFRGSWRLPWLLMCLCVAPLIYVLQLGPAPVHIHHLLWAALCFALFPNEEKRAQWSLRAVLAGLYFFPGLWKLMAGSQWLSGDILQRTMQWKWAQYWDLSPKAWMLDWAQPLALTVLIFELSSPLLLSRYGRWIAAAGVLFHWATAWAIGIHFPSLWLLLLCLLSPCPAAAIRTLDRPRSFMLGMLLAGICIAGFTRTLTGFPFACYPSFDTLPAKSMPLLTMSAECSGDTQLISYKKHMRPSNHAWAQSWQLAGIGAPVNPQHLEQHWATHSDDIELPCEAKAILFHRSRLELSDWPPVVTTGPLLHRMTATE